MNKCKRIIGSIKSSKITDRKSVWYGTYSGFEHKYCDKDAIIMQDYDGAVSCLCEQHWEELLKDQEEEIEWNKNNFVDENGLHHEFSPELAQRIRSAQEKNEIIKEY